MSNWFSERIRPFHFKKSKALDDEIREAFNKIYQAARDGKLEEWQSTADSSLALVILLDQFPRNMFRQLPQSFITDQKALSVSKNSISKNFDARLTQEQCAFLYMPFMHSENAADQEMSVELYQELGNKHNLEFAIAHRDIITRFGRFPHRNAILDRECTADEIEFLKQPNSGF